MTDRLNTTCINTYSMIRRATIFFTVGLIILFSLRCGSAEKNIEIKLACTINTFDAPISAISGSPSNQDILYIGLANGNIIATASDHRQMYSIKDNRIIYDILEYGKDSLFVGTRDGGLKLILTNVPHAKPETFHIEGKNSNYSVYSIAQDSLNRILYVGTSNGFFKLDLNDKIGSKMLQRIELENTDKHYGIHKVLFRDGTLHIAGDPGLFIGNPNEGFAHSVKNERINNITLNGDTLYAILEKAVISLKTPYSQDNSKPDTIVWDKFYHYDRSPAPDRDEWLLSGQSVFMKRNGTTYVHKLPDGIGTSGKQLALMGRDFYYVAYREELLAFPLHQNTRGVGNSVIAVSDRTDTDNHIYFITSNYILHKFNLNENQKPKSEIAGRIRGLHTEDGIVKFIHAGNEVFFLATRKYLYRIENNRAECIGDFNKKGNGKDNDFNAIYFSAGERKLYVGTRQYLGVVDCRHKSGYSLQTVHDIDTTDLYVVGISGRNEDIYAATLNKGLYRKSGNQEPFKEDIWNTREYGSIYGLAVSSREDVILNTSTGIIRNDQAGEIEKLDYLDHENIKAIHRIYEQGAANGIFVIDYHGLYFLDFSRRKEQPAVLFKDISFDQARIADKGDKAVLGDRSGLFLFDGSELAPVTIQKEKNRSIPYFLTTGLLMLIIAIYLWGRGRGKKLAKYMDELNSLKAQAARQVKREDREILIPEFNAMISKLTKYRQSRYIKDIPVRKLEKEMEMLRTNFSEKVMTLDEYIQNNLKDAGERIKNIENMPGTRGEEPTEKLKKIIDYKEKIKPDSEYYTVKHSNELVSMVLALEKERVKSIAAHRHIIEKLTPSSPIEAKIDALAHKVENGHEMASIAEECDKFVSEYPQLRKLSFMHKRRSGNRYFIAILFFIKDIKAETICDTLKLHDPQYVNRFKYKMRMEIKELYNKGKADEVNDEAIAILYDRIKSTRQSHS